MGGDRWDPQIQQALRMDGIIIVVIIIIVVVVIIIVVVVIIIVVVVVGKGKAIKRKYKLLVTPASGSPEVDQGLVKRSLKIR
jgi:flagellar basal body-associated protein FliL